MSPDYYTFYEYGRLFPHSRQFRTLREAKNAYWNAFCAGCHLNGSILGMTSKDDYIFLTYTPFYNDTHTFGRTITTEIGKMVKDGEYEF